MKQKTYSVCRYYPNGRVVMCADFSTAERANAIARKWHSENPAAFYQVHEREEVRV